jgi:aminoglycoside/choline kinase family phosphotransferase
MDRQSHQQSFLNAVGWGSAKRTELPADASFRRYCRLQLGKKTVVFMDAPPAQEDTTQFVAIASHLRSIGLNAPKIFGEDRENGFLLLEDLGNKKFSEILKTTSNSTEKKLYREAVTLLCTLQQFSPPSWLPRYTAKILLREADLFLDWYWPLVKSTPINASERNSYRTAWEKALALTGKEGNVLVLRDFHVDNLMWLPDRSGVQRIGLLDFQDALSGSSIYDLVSLLEDVRRDVTHDLVDEMREHYLTSRQLESDNFGNLYSILGAQRSTKILGIFTRLWKRDGKSHYLKLIPRAWRLLDNSLQNSALRPVRTWFDKHFPTSYRTIPNQVS